MDADARVALVTPWFGASLTGGAETLAWQLANRLVDRGRSVDVLCTCNCSFLDDWSINHHPVGVEELRPGLAVHRFPVARRDAARFHRANAILLRTNRSLPSPGEILPDDEVARAWMEHGIRSPALVKALRERADTWCRVIFLPYLYPPILAGLPEVRDRSILVPCLHRESYAWLSAVWRCVAAAGDLAFLSAGEALVAEEIFGPQVLGKSSVIGCGIEPVDLDPAMAATGCVDSLAEETFLLCLGRRDAEKGVDDLVAAFAAGRTVRPEPSLKLVLAGPGVTDYGARHPDCLDLGMVTRECRAWLLHHCAALVQPSRHESFSRVLMEAWHCGRPAIVDGRCLATATAVRSCGGGAVATGLEEWTARLLDMAVMTSAQREEMGTKGRAYAAEEADWDHCLDRLETLINRSSATVRVVRRRTVHQLLPGFRPGDAISDAALHLRYWLRGEGFDSDIVAVHVHDRLATEAIPYHPGVLAADEGILYHHSIGNEITAEAVTHPGPKALIYHNITPPEFYQSFDGRMAALLQSGYDRLAEIAGAFVHRFGDSPYNCRELDGLTVAAGETRILPLTVDPAKWSVEPNGDLLRSLRAGKVINLLFVGRFAPNKRQLELVEVLHHLLRMGLPARLLLVGFNPADDPYSLAVWRRIEALGLGGHCYCPGMVPLADLAACYRAADLFVSLSLHEGFCVPLVEAMLHDVPILAAGAAAVPETLAGAGIVFPPDLPADGVAALAFEVLSDQTCQISLAATARRRRECFFPGQVDEDYARLLLPIFA